LLRLAVPFDAARLETKGESVPVVEGVRRAIAGTVGAQGNPLLTGTAQFSTSPAGSLMYLPGPASPMGESHDLALVDRAGVVERLNLPGAAYSHTRISPDGTWLAFGIDDGKEANVYVYRLKGGMSAQRVTFGGRNRFPIWTADSRRIVFQSDRNGDRGIYWEPVEGAPRTASRRRRRARHMSPSRGHLAAIIFSTPSERTRGSRYGTFPFATERVLDSTRCHRPI